MSSERVALFGGSFDPPHNGHINIVLSLLESFDFSQVVIIPTGKNPLKHHCAHTFHRNAMCRLAFSHFSHVSILDHEIIHDSSAGCFTIDTVRYLQKTIFPHNDLSFVMGGDCVKSIHMWKEPEELFTLVAPFIVSRGDLSDFHKVISELPVSPVLQQKLASGVRVSCPRFDISSTDIRYRLKNNLWVSHMLPSDVERYIRHHNVYM